MNLQIFLNMFITAICFLFLIKLRWPKNKRIHENKFLMNYSRSITTYSQSGYTKKTLWDPLTKGTLRCPP